VFRNHIGTKFIKRTLSVAPASRHIGPDAIVVNHNAAIRPVIVDQAKTSSTVVSPFPQDPPRR